MSVQMMYTIFIEGLYENVVWNRAMEVGYFDPLGKGKYGNGGAGR